MIVPRVIALSLVASVFVLAISLASFAFADQHQQASPIAYDQKYNTTDSTKSAIPVTLKANSPDYNLLTFAIVSGPAHGALGTITKNDTLSKITNNNIDPTSVKVTYTPQKDYVGDDSFTFKVNDGFLDSSAATISITIDDFPPIQFTSFKIAGGGQFRFMITAQSERNYLLESSTDLTAWSPVATISNPTGTMTYFDAVAGIARFYRAKLAP